MRLKTLKKCLNIKEEKRKKGLTKKQIVEEYDRIYNEKLQLGMSQFLANEVTTNLLNKRHGKKKVSLALCG